MQRRSVLRAFSLGPWVVGAGYAAPAHGTSNSIPLQLIGAPGCDDRQGSFDAGMARFVQKLRSMLKRPIRHSPVQMQADGEGHHHSDGFGRLLEDPVLSLASCIPFGLDARQFVVWWVAGGGQARLNMHWASEHGFRGWLVSVREAPDWVHLPSSPTSIDHLCSMIRPQGALSESIVQRLSLSGATCANPGAGESGEAVLLSPWWATPRTLICFMPVAEWQRLSEAEQVAFDAAAAATLLHDWAGHEARPPSGHGSDGHDDDGSWRSGSLLWLPPDWSDLAAECTRLELRGIAECCEAFAQILAHQHEFLERLSGTRLLTEWTRRAAKLAAMR